MRGTTLIILSAIALTRGASIDIEFNRDDCPIDFTVEKLLPHENCNQFYQCFNGLRVAQSCPVNLFYNIDTHECDWSYNVECGDRIIPDNKDNEENNNGDDNEENGNDAENNNEGNGHSDPSEAPAICAAEGSDGVLVAHEDCTKFYKCWQGRPEVISCPVSLFYNPTKEQCDWPQNVQCNNRNIPDLSKENKGEFGDNSDPSEANAICAQEGSNGELVAHENCNQFYKCSYGLPVGLYCPQGLLYNVNNQQCDWEYNVDCGSRVIPENDGDDNQDNGNENEDNDNNDNNNNGGNGDPSEAPAICAAEGSDGILVAHENCNQFYKCSEGRPVSLNCPLNLLYNYKNEQCDWPENVDCGNRVIPDEKDDESNDNGGSDNGGNEDDANEDDANEDDESDNNNVNGNGDPSEAPAICAEEGSDGVLVAHEKCNQFYKCYAGHPVVMKCPLNLLYNFNKEQCDWPQNVECGDRVIPDEIEDEGNDSDGGDNGGSDNGGGDNDGGDNGGSDNDGGDNGDSDNDNNEGENGVGDDGGDNNGGNSDPSEAPAICAAENSDSILVAHENCNQFYKCFNGKPVSVDCPSNLIFNPALNVCDWPQNVNCGDRIINSLVHFIN